MEKFPVRMKDNDLLVTQLFEDPCKEPITALSVYFTPNVCKSHLRTSLDIVMERNGRFVHNRILGIPLLCRSIFYTETPLCVCVCGGGGFGGGPPFPFKTMYATPASQQLPASIMVVWASLMMSLALWRPYSRPRMIKTRHWILLQNWSCYTSLEFLS